MPNGTQISVRFDAGAFRRVWDQAVAKQIPFATARALTLVAAEARDALKADLASTFTIRNDRTAKGIRSTRATKQNLEAEVGSKDQYMERQAEGGDKIAKGGGAVAVPFDARPTPKTITPRSKWPRALLRSKRRGAYLGPVGGAMGVWKRPEDPKGRPRLMYLLLKSVRVEPRWKLDETVRGVVGRLWTATASRALAEAIKSRKV